MTNVLCVAGYKEESASPLLTPPHTPTGQHQEQGSSSFSDPEDEEVVVDDDEHSSSSGEENRKVAPLPAPPPSGWCCSQVNHPYFFLPLLFGACSVASHIRLVILYEISYEYLLSGLIQNYIIRTVPNTVLHNLYNTFPKHCFQKKCTV